METRSPGRLLLLPTTLLLLVWCVDSSNAEFSCRSRGRESGAPLSCATFAPGKAASASSVVGPASSLRRCLWNLLPCRTNASWNAVLHHPETDVHLSKSFLYENGAKGHEMSVKQIFMRYLKTQDDPLVLDIGANIGTHSLWFAAMGYRTHSFEPLKKNFALLECSVVASPHVHGKIRVNNFGLGAKVEDVCMVSEKDNFGGTHMEGASGCSPENIASVRRLDWYWTNVLKKEQVFFLKADIEGFEPHMVDGGHVMFTERPPKVALVEYVPSFITKVGGNHSRFLEQLHSYGYVRHNPWNKDFQRVSTAEPNTDLVLVHKSFLPSLGIDYKE